MASGPRNRQAHDGPAVPPAQLASVPTPPSNLSNHKDTISYALGQLGADVRHLTDNIEKLRSSTAANFKEQKDAIKVINDNILVAETQVSSAFYTSKYFLTGVAALAGWAFANRDWLINMLPGHK